MDEVAELELPTQENVHADLRSVFQGAVKLALETVLDEVVRDLIGARRWQRLATRKDVRNGTYLRSLLTTMGLIEVSVPRTRENGSAADVLGRYRRRSAEIDDGIVAAYVSGASTRDVGGITEALVGERVSRSTVSRVTATLGEKVEQLRKAPITGPIPYLFLDATFIDARWARKVENVSALVAYGIGLDGHRQLLAVTIGAEESESSWSDLLGQLLERGLSGVELVVADAHAGIAKAVRHHLPESRSSDAPSTSSGTCSPRRPSASGRALRRPSRRCSRRRARLKQGSVSTPWRRGSVSRCPKRWSAYGPASRRRPSSTPSLASTGTASARRTGSSGSTGRSSAGRGRWAPSLIAPAPYASSPPSRCR